MVKVYTLSGVSMQSSSLQSSSLLVLPCEYCMVVLGTLTGECSMGETDERSEQLSLLLQGGELVVEVDRNFEDMGLLSLLIQPGELVVQVDRMCAVS